jgi:GMP synthase (glutamine-hydrolysing)
MKLLLLQIRHEASVRREEYESFLRYCRLAPEELDILNVFDTPVFGPDALEGYDALLVGGASEASVLEPDNYPAVPYCIELLRHSIDVDFPVFASCFGFQLAVLALGGEIIRDESGFEMGSVPISLRDAARDDLLFRDVPDGFQAISVHRERSVHCPISRLTIFREKYTDGDDHLDEVLNSAVETPESNALMGKFVDRVLRQA